MSQMAVRMRQLIDARLPEHRRFKTLETMSGISAEAWRAFWNDRQKPSSEMFSALAQEWPQYAFWLSTGITDPDFGHVAPVRAAGYTVLKGKEQPATTAEFRYLIQLLRQEPQDEDQLAVQKAQILRTVKENKATNLLRATYFNFQRALEGYDEAGRDEFYVVETDMELNEIRRRREAEIAATAEVAKQWRTNVRKNIKLQAGLQALFRFLKHPTGL
jgi:DNA-binding TFAR19-related protein (PDSD5 family)